MEENFDIDRTWSLIEERDTAIMLLEEGIWHIARWRRHEARSFAGEDRRILGLFLISLGMERLLKLTMALILHGENIQPSSQDFKNDYGHRLTGLLDIILSKARDDAFLMKWKAFRNDIDFCESDRHFREMLDILEDFGIRGRYHNLNMVLDSRSKTDHPIRRWNTLEQTLYKEDLPRNELDRYDKGQWGQQSYPCLAEKQTAILQRVARFILRMWRIGPAREHGQSFVDSRTPFVSIEDEYLGVPAQARYF